MFDQTAPLDVETVEEAKEYTGRHRAPETQPEDVPASREFAQLGW